MTVQLYLVNPPATKGRTNERAQSGDLGVSRKLKFGEREYVDLLPHDFLYQAAIAEKAGHRVKYIDLVLERIFDNQIGLQFVERVIQREPSEQNGTQLWIGVRLSMPSLHNDLRMANLLKRAYPNARVYAFGSVIMTTYRHWFDQAKFDFLFYGEPEAIIEEALSAANPMQVAGVIDIATHVPPTKPGLYEMASNLLHNKWRKVTDIGKLPRAAWHLLELGRYAPNGQVSELAVSIPASRGCFMPCTMCAYNLNEGRMMRFRTPEEVLDEIEFLFRTYGIRHIRFRDPNFSANQAHLEAIAQGLIDRHLPIEAAAELSLELLDRRQLELMYQAGIRTILTGVESNDAEIMRSIGQNVRISRILEGKVAICRELGLKLYTFFIVGSPEESWHTVQDTFTFARSLGTESTMTAMTPFPGTPMYWRALQDNLLVCGREMTYELWNSYTATMRTYRMSLWQVNLARTWARLETYIPFIWGQMPRASFKGKLRLTGILAPRVVALALVRLYTGWQLYQEDKAIAKPASGGADQASLTVPIATRIYYKDLRKNTEVAVVASTKASPEN